MPAPLAADAAAAIQAAARRTRPSVHLLPIPEARRAFEQESLLATGGQDTPPAPGTSIVEIDLKDGLRARLYRPSNGQLPVVLFFHGGGWVLGSIDTHDQMCRTLATASGCAVLSVDYRRAPEHPFPYAVHDAVTALHWVTANGSSHQLDHTCVAVAGDSAGGNIAIALALQAADSPSPPRIQLLFYPVTTTDLEIGFDDDYDGVVLSREELLWHQQQYLPQTADRHAPLASPLDQAQLTGLPPALIIAAECDPIAPQSLQYARALEAAGVPVDLHLYPGMIHGFAQYPAQFQAARQALTAAGVAVRTALTRTPPLSGATHEATPSPSRASR